MMKKYNLHSGMTLVEVMIGILILFAGGGVLLVGMQTSVIHTQYLSELQVALHAVEGRMQELMATSFETLEGPTFFAARDSGGQFETIAGLTDGGLSIQIQVPSADFLDIHVAACWTSRGRLIGDDQNCNGVMDVGEDADGDLWLNSPAELETRVAR